MTMLAEQLHLSHKTPELHSQLVQDTVSAWSKMEPDLVLLAMETGGQAYSTMMFLSMFSPSVRDLCSTVPISTSPMTISVPVSQYALENLLAVLTTGSVLADSKDNLMEVTEAADCLGIQLRDIQIGVKREKETEEDQKEVEKKISKRGRRKKTDINTHAVKRENDKVNENAQAKDDDKPKRKYTKKAKKVDVSVLTSNDALENEESLDTLDETEEKELNTLKEEETSETPDMSDVEKYSNTHAAVEKENDEVNENSQAKDDDKPKRKYTKKAKKVDVSVLTSNDALETEESLDTLDEPEEKEINTPKEEENSETPDMSDVEQTKGDESSSDESEENKSNNSKKVQECPECGKVFSNAAGLKLHKIVHTGEKPFKCDQCEKSFGQKGSLSNHKVLHSGEKPFKCDHCDKAFTQKGNLKTHMKVHSNNAELLS